MVKQVILFRKDLNMRLGKVAAQVAHASMKVFLDLKQTPLEHIETTEGRLINPLDALLVSMDKHMAEWVGGSFAKIVLSVATEEDLLRAYALAKEAGLPTSLITDSGKTEFHGVLTHTTVAIGPAPAEDIDKITGPQGAVSCKLA
jgi:PTH2 family peptidyl-tRNA hydrolase